MNIPHHVEAQVHEENLRVGVSFYVVMGIVEGRHEVENIVSGNKPGKLLQEIILLFRNTGQVIFCVIAKHALAEHV